MIWRRFLKWNLKQTKEVINKLNYQYKYKGLKVYIFWFVLNMYYLQYKYTKITDIYFYATLSDIFIEELDN